MCAMPNMEFFSPSYQPHSHYQYDGLPTHYSDEHQVYNIPSHNTPLIPIPKTNETKPRLGKDEVDILERAFNKNPKPTTQTKRQFAEEMGVELARINNWFQNRRAKRKQEKKQVAYEAGQAQEALDYSEPSSPDAYTSSSGYYSDTHLVPASTTTFPTAGPRPPVASYNPQYTDPTTASMESLQRALASGQNGTQISEEYHFAPQHSSMNAFGDSNAHDFADADRAQFPAPETFIRFDHNQSFSYSTAFDGSTYDGTQSVSDIHSSPEDTTNQTPTPYNSFHASATGVTTLQPITTTFPSQLLPAHSNDLPALSADSGCSESPEDTMSAYGIGLNIENSNSSPASSVPFKSPPPMNIALRRKKVQHKPMALSATVMNSRPPTGPRTHSQAEGFRKPSDSPCSSPMRRIVSAGGSRPSGVLSGRINKSGVESAQKSPINFGGFESAGNFLEQQYHSLRNPPGLSGASSLSSSLAPPTPMSPGMSFVKREMHRSSQSTASPENANLNFIFPAETPACFTTMDGDQNLQSPPETPQGPILHQPTLNNWTEGTKFVEEQWTFEVMDEPLYTPGMQDTFPMEVHMPRPSYMPSMTQSQPVTPAFDPAYNRGFVFGHESPPWKHESPQFGISTHSGQEYAFPDSNPFPPGMSPNMSKQKTFQFSHTTAADYSEK